MKYARFLLVLVLACLPAGCFLSSTAFVHEGASLYPPKPAGCFIPIYSLGYASPLPEEYIVIGTVTAESKALTIFHKASAGMALELARELGRQNGADALVDMQTARRVTAGGLEMVEARATAVVMKAPNGLRCRPAMEAAGEPGEKPREDHQP
jgi:hypothetical protein